MNLKLCTLWHTVVLLVFLEIFDNQGVTIYIKRAYEGQEAAYYTHSIMVSYLFLMRGIVQSSSGVSSSGV